MLITTHLNFDYQDSRSADSRGGHAWNARKMRTHDEESNDHSDETTRFGKRDKSMNAHSGRKSPSIVSLLGKLNPKP
jgi:hypothetical protein